MIVFTSTCKEFKASKVLVGKGGRAIVLMAKEKYYSKQENRPKTDIAPVGAQGNLRNCLKNMHEHLLIDYSGCGFSCQGFKTSFAGYYIERSEEIWEEFFGGKVGNSRQVVSPWRLSFLNRVGEGLPGNPMPEFDVPGGAAVFHDRLDDERHAMSFRIAHIHPTGMALTIDQDEIILGDRGSHHRIGLPGRRDEGFGRQMLLFFQIQ
jgi:hypothetical protein